MGADILIVSDVDNTLLGDDEALRRFTDWHRPRRQKVRLVYSSGRFFESVAESVAATLLPEPDAIIGGVGTQMRLYPGGAEIASWRAGFRNWDDRIVQEVAAAFAELEPQPAELQSTHKVSYYVYDAAEPLLDRLRAALEAAGVDAAVVYSSRRDLDIIPAGAGKGQAATHLAAAWGFEAGQVIVCGDSANDLAMFEQGFLGVVVANAHEELLRLSGENVYHAQGRCAAGVLEGVRHWCSAKRAALPAG